MAGATAADAALPPMTKGLEFEFAALWRFDSDKNGNVLVEIEGDVQLIDGVIVISRERLALPPGEQEWEFGTAQQVARRAIYQLLLRHGIEVHDTDHYDEDIRELNLGTNHRWAINTLDPRHYYWNLLPESMVADFDPELELDVSRTPHNVLDVELTSPALTNGTVADEEIARVLKIVKDNLIYFVHPRCGFHVHVGQGQVLWTIEQLRKIAPVCYAIETWFNELHPDHRHDNRFCISHKRRSRLAAGMTAAQANECVRREAGKDFLPFKDTAVKPKISLQQAWTELNGAESATAVAILLNYPCAAYNLAEVDDLGMCTIEFRQAAGTLNEEWALHWSNLVCGLVDWARRTSAEQVRNLLFSAEVTELFWQGKLNDMKKQGAVLTVDGLIRRTLNMPEIADYIHRTNADTRATPRVTGDQARWRDALSRRHNGMFGPMILPRANWP
ncbi:hypothetical protein E8E14_003225 [Neopestalotiopsis sp. 37M]|nr:hypothetical protein E8E14_003225 [Neopestalotiopsis sp. 37M]